MADQICSNYRYPFRLLACAFVAAFWAFFGIGCSSVEISQRTLPSAKATTNQAPSWADQRRAIDEIGETSHPKQQIYFTTKVIGISRPGGDGLVKSSQKILDDAEFQELVQTYTQTKGVDLLSAPSVVTRSGQPSKIEIVRELVYPSGPEVGAETKKVKLGITIHLLGFVSNDQKSIRLKTHFESTALAGNEHHDGTAGLHKRDSNSNGEQVPSCTGPKFSSVSLGGKATIMAGQTVVFSGPGDKSEKTTVTRHFGIRVKSETEPQVMELMLAVTGKLIDPSGAVIE